MRFRVKRTSVWDDDVQPCPEAEKGTYTKHVYCTLRLSKAMEAPETAWFRRFTNHRSAPGGSVADSRDTPCWFVELDDLDALLAFIDRYGEVVVNHQSDGATVEIYDGYRE